MLVKNTVNNATRVIMVDVTKTHKHAALDSIYTEDCVSFMATKVKPGSVDLVVTSPPYDNLRNYEGYDFDFKSTADALYKVTGGGEW